ncbi:hypothetical protein CEUSTIGMA_g2391.t1 [Chlamydomonas eustigma]|uniref:ACT domain-containing protein n=1 Tax=Chlamydomonas eustigma TaxID=1157962 RepID=A0A250WVX4_9CHLO|nr:hypothetical protein CEUSTIGMA_g2391.t1 [Chlamydomonas eustigma]|eukprot:GAX74945.1 hypothetical protein CEUSTIGMA_g2391.t1 [Chlamydomonas eustigma]
MINRNLNSVGHSHRSSRYYLSVLPRRVQLRAAAVDDSETCSILSVKIDNDISPKYSKLTIDVMNYPALLRTVAWTLNGLGIRAQNAKMKVMEGFSEQEYWLTDLKGQKLSDPLASCLQDSLEQFIETCMPANQKHQEAWEQDNVSVSNRSHDTFTELVIHGEPAKPGFLLEIATVLSAIGVTVQEGAIQGDPEFGPCCEQAETHDFAKQGRIFKFLLSKGEKKLSTGRVAAVFFILDLVAGRGYQPTKL